MYSYHVRISIKYIIGIKEKLELEKYLVKSFFFCDTVPIYFSSTIK